MILYIYMLIKILVLKYLVSILQSTNRNYNYLKKNIIYLYEEFCRNVKPEFR